MFSDGGAKQGATVPALGGPLPPPYLPPTPPPQEKKGSQALPKKETKKRGSFLAPELSTRAGEAWSVSCDIARQLCSG